MDYVTTDIEPTLYQGIVHKKWTVKQIYKYLVICYKEKPKAIERWCMDLNEDITQEWFDSCWNSKILDNVRLKSFHLRFINRAYMLNYRSVHFVPDSSDKCCVCKQVPETFIHLFWNCPQVQEMIVKVKDFLIEFTLEEGDSWSEVNFLLTIFVEPVTVVVVTLLK